MVSPEGAMRPIFATILLYVLAGAASGQEVPTTGQVTDERENSSLNYECLSVEGGQLSCSFVQGMFSKAPVVDADELASQATELAASPISAADCVAYRNALATFQSGGDFGIPLTELQREDGTRSMASVVAFCDAPTVESAMEVLRVGQDRAARTCSVSHFRFDMVFDWDFERKRWEAVTSPSGACGIVVAAFMEPEYTDALPDYAMWNYRQQKIVTNREGSDALMGACADWPESENRSSWRGRELPLQCDYIKFGF
jgi:hypothetical protein